MNSMDAFRMPVWYPELSADCFPTVFAELEPEEVEALKQGAVEGEAVNNFLPRLERVMKQFSGARFVSVDTVAPTDTERFKVKRGAVHSVLSAWKVLAASEKVRAAANAGLVTSVCVRPFRRMRQAREFRLFIKNSRLAGMSQYWLVRHFRRLASRREKYWRAAAALTDRIAGRLPASDLAVDIYFTSSGRMLILDLNVWGPPTAPLMYNSWERDWGQAGECLIVPEPHTVSGEVNVHF